MLGSNNVHRETNVNRRRGALDEHLIVINSILIMRTNAHYVSFHRFVLRSHRKVWSVSAARSKWRAAIARDRALLRGRGRLPRGQFAGRTATRCPRNVATDGEAARACTSPLWNELLPREADPDFELVELLELVRGAVDRRQIRNNGPKKLTPIMS
jgi:hypothetical protein